MMDLIAHGLALRNQISDPQTIRSVSASDVPYLAKISATSAVSAMGSNKKQASSYCDTYIATPIEETAILRKANLRKVILLRIACGKIAE